MKKKLASAALAVTLLGGSVPVFAEESTTSSTTTDTSVSATASTTAGTTQSSTSSTANENSTVSVQAVDPDSFLYKLKELLAQIKLVFTFDDQAKADLLIQQANEKIADLEALNQNGKIEYNEQFIEAIDQALEKAQEALKEAKVEAEEEQDTEAKTEIEQKEHATVEVEKHSLVVLKTLLNKVPEQGKKGIQNAIAKQEAKLKAKANAATSGSASTTIPAPVQPEAGSTTIATTNSSANTTTNATATTGGTSTEADGSAQVEANSKVQVPALDAAGVEVKTNNGLHLGHSKQLEKKPEKDKQEHGRQERDKQEQAKQEGKN